MDGSPDGSETARIFFRAGKAREDYFDDDRDDIRQHLTLGMALAEKYYLMKPSASSHSFLNQFDLVNVKSILETDAREKGHCVLFPSFAASSISAGIRKIELPSVPVRTEANVV